MRWTVMIALASLSLAATVACTGRDHSALPPVVVQVETPPASPPSLSPGASPEITDPAPVSPARPRPLPESKELVIRVKSGETLGLYARWADTTSDAVRALNGLKRVRHLRVGKKLRIELDPDQRVRFNRMRREFHRRRQSEWFRTHRVLEMPIYTVRAGDTLRSLSKRYSDVPNWLMEKVNPTQDLSHLHPNDKVNLPRVAEAPPVSAREAEARAIRAMKWMGEAGGGRVTPVIASPGPSGDYPLGGYHHDGLQTSLPGGAPLDERRRGRRSAIEFISAQQPPADAPWFSEDEEAEEADGGRAPFEGVVVKVRRRECLAHYARWSGLPLSQITSANGIADPSRVRIGQTVRLAMDESRVSAFYEARRRFHNGGKPQGAAPAGGASPSAIVPRDGADTFPYEVRAGDTGWSIASKRFGIGLDELRRVNPALNLDRLRVGQKLRIPSRVLR